jgi:hypothetical protein
VASSDFDRYYGAAVTTGKNPKRDVEKRNDAFFSSISETADPRNPFADPVLPPVNESILKRVDSPDSDYISADRSPHPAPRTLSFIPTDYYIDSSFLPEPSSPLDETYLEQGPAVPMQFTFTRRWEIEGGERRISRLGQELGDWKWMMSDSRLFNERLLISGVTTHDYSWHFCDCRNNRPAEDVG